MKKLKKPHLVAILAIIFIGIAGGFTKTVNHTSKSAGCETVTTSTGLDGVPQLNLDGTPLVCWSATGILEGEYGTRTVFDPKSTALFVIAGVIITLVGLEVRKKK